MNMIFLPTIQHTGTWFTMEALKVHSSVDAFIEMHALGLVSMRGSLSPSALFEKESFSKGGVTLLHMHIPLWDKESAMFSCGIRADATLFAGMLCSCPTVLPLRDPLLTLISAVNRRTRAPETYDISYLVNIWAQVAREYTLHNEAAKPYYWPVDLLTGSAQAFRVESMTRMFNCLGLTVNAGVSYRIGRFCKDWPLVRPTLSEEQVQKGLEFENTKKYADGDKDYFQEHLPKEWSKLRKAEPLVRPFLENIGYKDLLWWTP